MDCSGYPHGRNGQFVIPVRVHPPRDETTPVKPSRAVQAVADCPTAGSITNVSNRIRGYCQEQEQVILLPVFSVSLTFNDARSAMDRRATQVPSERREPHTFAFRVAISRSRSNCMQGQGFLMPEYLSPPNSPCGCCLGKPHRCSHFLAMIVTGYVSSRSGARALPALP